MNGPPHFRGIKAQFPLKRNHYFYSGADIIKFKPFESSAEVPTSVHHVPVDVLVWPCMHIPPSLARTLSVTPSLLHSLNGNPAHHSFIPLPDSRKDLRRRHSRGSIITHAAQDKSGGSKPETKGKGACRRAESLGLRTAACGLRTLSV